MIRHSRRHRDRGQSSVEFALVLPILLLVLLAMIHVGIILMTKLAVTHTAREVARSLAIDASTDPDQVAALVRPFGSGALDITVQWKPAAVDGRRVVEVRVSDRVEGIGGFWAPSSDVTSTVAMLGE